MKSEDMTRRALDAMDRLNEKKCQEELERINANIYPDTKFDCGNCQFSNPDRTTAFLTELKSLMERYNVTIDVEGDECYLDLLIEIDGRAIEYNSYDFYTGKNKQTALTPDNIFDYKKR